MSEVDLLKAVDKLRRFMTYYRSYNCESHEQFSNGWVAARLSIACEILDNLPDDFMREFRRWQENGEPIECEY